MKRALILACAMAMCYALTPIAAGQVEPAQSGNIQSAATGCNANVPANAQTGLPVPFDGMFSIAPGTFFGNDSIVGSLYIAPATGPGGFRQGSPSGEACRNSGADESQFTHILTRNLAVMETEVSQASWDNLRFLQPTLPAKSFSHPWPANPVESVSWYEAVLFANLLSVQRGFNRCYYTNSTKTNPIDSSNYNNNNTIYLDMTADGYRLPTEGEWEYFARAGTTGPFSVNEQYYGSSTCSSCTTALFSLMGVAWYCGNSSGTTHEVGTLSSNPWNLRDVHGNADEWCWDWQSGYPSGTVTDYTGPASGTFRIARGGHYANNPSACRSASRGYTYPDVSSYPSLGFRLVKSIPIMWDWDFGDGSLHAFQSNAHHSYSHAGTFTWTVTATVEGTPCVKTGQIGVSDACTAASIVIQPQSQTISSGQTATLTVIAGGTAPFTDQWYQGPSGDTHSPASADSYSFTTPALFSTTSYWARVTNGCNLAGADSVTATITVTGSTISGPTITSIKSKTSKAGSSATIYGTGFSTDKKKDVVYFGTKKVKNISKVKTTSLKVTIPKVRKGTCAVTVLVNGVTSNAFTFTVK